MSEPGCTCIGPCLHPDGVQHPTDEEKRRFAAALANPTLPLRKEEYRVVKGKHVDPKGLRERVRKLAL